MQNGQLSVCDFQGRTVCRKYEPWFVLSKQNAFGFYHIIMCFNIIVGHRFQIELSVKIHNAIYDFNSYHYLRKCNLLMQTLPPGIGHLVPASVSFCPEAVLCVPIAFQGSGSVK